MKKQINLAVASAVLAMGASAAQAGIIIPAGDWTVDINGNVNAYYIYNNSKDSNQVDGGLANTKGSNGDNSSSINTGLLPSWLGVSGKTRANDLDVGFTISFQPGASTKNSLAGGGGEENRQAFLTFGDKSWGSIKIGKDLGVFGSDAILNDMTLLGVGSQGIVGTQGGTTTTLGRIGTGYLYADWHGQIAYSSPNWNGFDFTVAVENPWNTLNLSSTSASSSGNQEMPAFSAKVGYAWGGDVNGKVWAEGWTQHVDGIGSTSDSETASVFGIGAKVGFGDADLVGYYYDGSGVGTTDLLMDGFYEKSNGSIDKRDSKGGYVQGTYKLGATKLGVSWGESKLDEAGGENSPNLVQKNEMWTVGAYHALTKNLNLVAEYSQVTAENQAGQENDSDILSAGAILFF